MTSLIEATFVKTKEGSVVLLIEFYVYLLTILSTLKSMKHLKFLFLFISLVSLVSCSKSDVEDGVIADSNQVIFSGIIGEVQTRVSGTNWDKDDAIGVYALIAGKTAVFDEKINVKYATIGDGKFNPVVSGQAIRFPIEGNLDFVAYYPYDDKLTGLEYTIAAGSDPLFSNNAKHQNNKNPKVDLGFKHMLSRVVLNIEAGDYLASLEGLKASVNNVSVDGRFNLLTGDVVLGKEKTVNADITFGERAEGIVAATCSILVMPFQDIQDIEVEFSLGEDRYKWTASSSLELASSLEYEYNVVLNARPEPFVAEVGTAKIYDWDKGHKSTEKDILNPENKETSLEFFTDVTRIEFDSSSQLSRIIKLTAPESQAWTITKNADWLTLHPETGGTGGKDITLSVTKNTATTQRTAIVTIIPTDNKSLEPIIINVTQRGNSSSEKNDGTKQRPYTVAEAVANQREKGNKAYVWVKAFIVGTESSGLSLRGAVETNLLIADDKDESNVDNAMPAELPDNKVRNRLNLKYNRDMYKAEVLLYGTLEEYFRGPGLKGIKEFEVIKTN